MDTQPTETQQENQAAQPETTQVADVSNQAKPFRVFSSQDELNTFVQSSKKQAERKALNAQARELGYDDWQEMRDALQAVRKPTDSTATPTDSPTVADRGSDNEAKQLRMALMVAGELNLPAALIGRLQGSTLEEMKADAELLMGLFSQPAAQRSVGVIPAVPQGNQAVTFTRTQLQNAEFVRTHKDDILKAAREGRIVTS